MTLPFIDIAAHAAAAGFSGVPLSIAIALTVPESGRDPLRDNLSDPNGGSFGLWQINGVHDPDATGVYPDKVPTQAWIDRMHDPAENARAAFAVWTRAGKSFLPWGTFQNRLHEPSLDAAKVAMDAMTRLALRDIAIAAREAHILTLDGTLSALRASISDLADELKELGTA